MQFFPLLIKSSSSIKMIVSTIKITLINLIIDLSLYMYCLMLMVQRHRSIGKQKWEVGHSWNSTIDRVVSTSSKSGIWHKIQKMKKKKKKLLLAFFRLLQIMLSQCFFPLQTKHSWNWKYIQLFCKSMWERNFSNPKLTNGLHFLLSLLFV